jgi:hypothetical protein
VAFRISLACYLTFGIRGRHIVFVPFIISISLAGTMLSRSSSSTIARFKSSSLLKYKEDIEFLDIEGKLLSWDLPKAKPDSIYDMGMFKMFSTISVKTIERTIPIDNNFQTIRIRRRRRKI